MKPYYERDGITIYHGDCLETMPQFEPGSFALICPDLPYFRVKDEPWDRQWDNPAAFLAWIGQQCEQWQRILKPNGSLYVFASPEMANGVETTVKARFNVLNNIRWVKEDGWHKKTDESILRSYLSPWEAVIFAEQCGDRYEDTSRGLHKDVYAPMGRYIQTERERAGLTRNDVEVGLGYTSSTDPTRGTALCYRWEEGACLPTQEVYYRLRDYLNTHHHNGGSEYLRREYEDLRRPFNAMPDAPYTDVWTFKTVQDYPSKHPTEKPLALYEHIIRMSTRPGDTILDPTMGSGTALVAARNLGRKAVGIDIVEQYCRRATQRLAQPPLPGLLLPAQPALAGMG